MRIGVYGGTFDPVHLGHLILAETCREQAALDRILFIPAGAPPHKRDVAFSPGKQRAEMLELAIAGHPEFVVNRMEVKRDGPSYTVDTLRHLRNEYSQDELFLLMGADSLQDFPTWKDPREICELANLVVVNRGRQKPPPVESLSGIIGDSALQKIQIVSMPGIDISASELRERVRTGRSVRYLVPRAVERYLLEHRLYLVPPAT